MKVRTLLMKLTSYGLSVKQVNGKIRLSPLQLVNDKVLDYVRRYKNEINSALKQESDERHQKRKSALGERLHIFRILIRHFLNDTECRAMVNYTVTVINDENVEAYLDSELINFDYELEDAISMYRHYTPKPVLTCRCGYQPPFCSCEGVPRKGVVSCHTCEHFTPDIIGSGAGIGNCQHGIKFTPEVSGHMPLFRYAYRHCDKYIKLMK